MNDRRPYRRESEERRRDDLLAAALQLVAEGGAQAATVRAIADRAGVTPGLIRHYFQSKDDLTRAAYHRLMEQMTQDSAEVLTLAPLNPATRLAAFVVASVSPQLRDLTEALDWSGVPGLLDDPLQLNQQLCALGAALRGD